jgi:uncharacterized membrane protein
VLAGAGVLHLVRPEPFVGIVPPWLPAPRLLVLVSGVALLAGAAGLCARGDAPGGRLGRAAAPRRRPPANVEMLRSARATQESIAWQAALVLRLPLQLLLGWWVWRAALRRPVPGPPVAAPG